MAGAGPKPYTWCSLGDGEDRSPAERGAWNQVFRQEEEYLAYGKTECRMIKWMMEKRGLNNGILPCCSQP
jgi:hypothetical protein